MENAQARESVRAYIIKSVSVKQLEDDADLFGSGLASSLFAIQLMTFIEKNFSIKVTMDDLDMSNFKTVNAILNFIEKKKPA